MKMDDENQLLIIRGLPGSGKSRLGARQDCMMVAADDHFYDENGVYRFNPKDLPAAHANCLNTTRACLECGNDVVVHNTFSCRWEIQPYLDLAEETNSLVVVVDLFDGGLTDEELFERNTHGVPLETIRAMRARWEHDWRIGNPLPPWERN